MFDLLQRSKNVLEAPVIFKRGNDSVILYHQTNIAYSVSNELYSHIKRGDHESFEPFVMEREFLRRAGYHPDELIREGSRLNAISLNLLNGCNMSCTYCCVGPAGSYNRTKVSKMAPETAIRAIDFLIENSGSKVMSLFFFGGEPLMNWDTMYETLRYTATIRDKTWIYFLTTNGTMITDEIARVLARYRVKTNITLDGPRELQDKNRPLKNGTSSYQTIVDGVKKLKKAGAGIKIQSVMTKDSPLSYDELLAHLKGVAGSDDDSIVCSIQYEESAMTFNQQFRRDTFKREIDISRQRMDEILHSKPLRLRGIFVETLWRILAGHVDIDNRCTTGLKSIHVSPEGDIYNCHIAEAGGYFRIGSVFSGYSRDKNKLMEELHEPKKTCRTCWAYDICDKECPLFYAVMKKQGDEIDADPEYCEMSQTVIEDALFAASKLTYDNMKILARSCKREDQEKILHAFEVREALIRHLKHIKPCFIFPQDGSTPFTELNSVFV